MAGDTGSIALDAAAHTAAAHGGGTSSSDVEAYAQAGGSAAGAAACAALGAPVAAPLCGMLGGALAKVLVNLFEHIGGSATGNFSDTLAAAAAMGAAMDDACEAALAECTQAWGSNPNSYPPQWYLDTPAGKAGRWPIDRPIAATMLAATLNRGGPITGKGLDAYPYVSAGAFYDAAGVWHVRIAWEAFDWENKDTWVPGQMKYASRTLIAATAELVAFAYQTVNPPLRAPFFAQVFRPAQALYMAASTPLGQPLATLATRSEVITLSPMTITAGAGGTSSTSSPAKGGALPWVIGGTIGALAGAGGGAFAGSRMSKRRTGAGAAVGAALGLAAGLGAAWLVERQSPSSSTGSSSTSSSTYKPRPDEVQA